MIPGGGTSLPGADDGAKGGIEAWFAKAVLIGAGTASLLAYRRSNLDREGDGIAMRTE